MSSGPAVAGRPDLEPPDSPSAGRAATRSQVRGSSLLLMGRLMSIAAKLGAQVLVVRHLSTTEYGSWAYGLAAVAFLGTFAHLSLDKSVSRFATLYHQDREYDRFFGVILLVLITVLCTGLVFVVGAQFFPGLLFTLTGGESHTLALVLVMIFLVPLEALDTLLIAIFATLGRPRAIFVRRYVITPAVQVFVVLLLVLLKADVIFLAYGYVAGTLFGVLVSCWLLFRTLSEQGLLEHLHWQRIRMPVKALFSFSAPLMTSDWLTALAHSSGALLLGHYYSTEQVGLLRVVLPLAVLNQIVIQTFHMMYIPTASRLFARGDYDGLNELYWRTSLWIAVLTFPIFALTFGAARPLTVLLFGARYEAAGSILAILVVGQYVQAALGFNGATIKVIGKVGVLVVINLLAAIANIALIVALVPSFGALGAAVAMSVTMLLHNVLKQIGLRRAAGFRLFDARYIAPYRTLAAGAACLLLIRLLISNGAFLAASAAVVSVGVLLLTRRALQVGDVFPEVARIPLLRGLLT